MARWNSVLLSCLGLGLSLSLSLQAKDQILRLPASQIQDAASYSARSQGGSLLVIQNGKILFEDYPNGGEGKNPHKIFSGTKAFWNMAAFAATEDGLLSLEERVADTFPEWSADPLKKKITIRQLLEFTSGLDPAFDLHEDGILDRDAAALRKPVVAQPGTTFIYGPCSLQVFHAVLKRKLAAKGETPTHYLERKVLRPLGLGPQRYVVDRSGNPLLAAGFMMTARTWSLMGKTLLHNGQPMVAAASIDHCRSGTRANPAFSFGVWNNLEARRESGREVDVEKILHDKWPKQDWHGACLCRAAPSDLLACIGSGAQRLYVIPSMDLIVVRQGGDRSYKDGTFLRLLLGK